MNPQCMVNSTTMQDRLYTSDGKRLSLNPLSKTLCLEQEEKMLGI